MKADCFRMKSGNHYSTALPPCIMKQIEHLLRDRMGLDAASIGSALMQRMIRLRMRSVGLKRSEEYTKLVENSTEEWIELVEAMVVTETWFFRDPQSFEALT